MVYHWSKEITREIYNHLKKEEETIMVKVNIEVQDNDLSYLCDVLWKERNNIEEHYEGREADYEKDNRWQVVKRVIEAIYKS